VKVLRVTGDIPQNVNFAIRASTLANFLEANRVGYEVESGSTVMAPTDERAPAGAACHGCLFVAETSCERRNQALDRALLIETIAGQDAAFFRKGGTTCWG
jgi:hypothetical protein